MQRTLLIVSLIALAAAPAAAQGKSKEHRRNSEVRTSDNRRPEFPVNGDRLGQRSGDEDSDGDSDGDSDSDSDSRNASRSKTHRTYIDSRGLECREKSEIKKNGRRKYDVKCKEPKGRRADRQASNRDADDRRCTWLDSRCDRSPSSRRSDPRSRVPTSTDRRDRTVSEILGEIAAGRTPR